MPHATSAKTKTACCHLILSDDPYARSEKVDSLIASFLSPEEQKSAVTRCAASDISEEMITAMKTLPFLASCQVFVVGAIHKAKKKPLELLVRYLEHPSLHTIVIAEGEPFETVTDGVKALKALATVTQLRPETDSDLVRTVRGLLGRHKRQMTPGAVAMLVERSGGSGAFLETALDKLVLATGSDGVITEDMVEQLVETMVQYDSFALTNALAAQRMNEALMILNTLIAEGTKEVEIIGMIGWQLRRFIEAKVLQAQGMAPGEIGSRLRIGPAFQRRFMEQTAHYSERELIQAIDALVGIDAHVKRSERDGVRELELFIVRFCTRKFL